MNVGFDKTLIVFSSTYSKTYGYLFNELGALLRTSNNSFLSAGQFFVIFSNGFLYVYVCYSLDSTG